MAWLRVLQPNGSHKIFFGFGNDKLPLGFMPGWPDISIFLPKALATSGLVSGALRAKGSYELFFGFRPEFSHNPDNAGAGSLAWHGAH